MKRKSKILVLGGAFAADLHLDAYSRLGEIAEVVGLCARSPAKTALLAARWNLPGVRHYQDFRQAIAESDADLVDVCLPNYLHAQASLAAFAAGKHVVCEKPLATKLEDAEAMVAAAAQSGRRLYYAEDWLFAPALVKALALVGEGGIGRPLYVRARECHSGSHSPFAQTLEFCGGGSLLHLGIHPVGFVLALKNQPWKEVTGMDSGGLENNLRHQNLEGEDWAAGLLRFEDGTTALVEANYLTAGGMEDQIDIYGDKGRLHIDLASSPIRAFSIPGLAYTVEKAEVTTGWSGPTVDERYTLGYAEEMRHFVECSRAEEGAGVEAKRGVRGVDGLEALRVVTMLTRSAREGRTLGRTTATQSLYPDFVSRESLVAVQDHKGDL